ncbi:hypothetical protein G6F49_012876 [Rhizopus delemar]|nr:hypothetical protein G6F49_012876 [Rhizopus delemar]
MAEEFLGLKISVLLHSGARIEGTFLSIEPFTRQLTLKDVTLYFFGQPPHHAPIHGIYGKDIKDLNTESIQQQQQQKPQIIEPQISINKSFSTSKNKKKKQSQQTVQQAQQWPRNNRKNNNNSNNSWADKDVSSYQEIEFDFQKNLNRFDKAKVFAEIRETDKTSQEDLLVSLNRQRNLLPTENVLDEEPKNKPKLWTETNHTPVPSFPLATLTRIEHEYTKVSQHREGLLIENSAKGAAILAMRLLRGLSSGSVVVLVGNNKNGAVGLAMARMMVDRGYQVTVCLASSNKDHLCRLVAFEYHTLYNLGVPIVYHPSDIKDDCNLVVDAILGPENKLMDNLGAFHAITEAISWAKCQNKPILSIDFPSGIDADTGLKKKEKKKN